MLFQHNGQQKKRPPLQTLSAPFRKECVLRQRKLHQNVRTQKRLHSQTTRRKLEQ